MQFGTTKNKIICVNVLNSGCKSPNCLIITELVAPSNLLIVGDIVIDL